MRSRFKLKHAVAEHPAVTRFKDYVTETRHHRITTPSTRPTKIHCVFLVMSQSMRIDLNFFGWVAGRCLTTSEQHTCSVKAGLARGDLGILHGTVIHPAHSPGKNTKPQKKRGGRYVLNQHSTRERKLEVEITGTGVDLPATSPLNVLLPRSPPRSYHIAASHRVRQYQTEGHNRRSPESFGGERSQASLFLSLESRF